MGAPSTGASACRAATLDLGREGLGVRDGVRIHTAR